jgi:hypothetical protein
LILVGKSASYGSSHRALTKVKNERGAKWVGDLVPYPANNVN